MSIYGPSDAASYNSENVWYNSALEFEVYDVDICVGHAANGDYHHHNNPTCIQERLSDNGSEHSPIYGWMLDGFPIYGPYQAASTLAESCWLARNYSATSATGCGTDNARTCVLNDPYDYTQGTMTVSAGPSTTASVTSQSGNTIYTVSGVYLQDFYYSSACTTSGGVNALDENSGHSHGDLVMG